MEIGDLVKVFNQRGLNELGYIKKFGQYGRSYVMVVYLTGSHVGKERFFSALNVIPISKRYIGEQRA